MSDLQGVLGDVVRRSLEVFETDEGVTALEARRWVRDQEKEWCWPADEKDVARGKFVRAGPPAEGVKRVYFPRLPKGEYLKQGVDRLPEAPGKLEALVRGMRMMGTNLQNKFMAERKAVVRQDSSSHQTVMIVPSKLTPMKVQTRASYDSLDEKTRERIEEFDLDIKCRKYKKTYLLQELFDNPKIALLYNAAPRALSSLRLVGAHNPSQSASVAQDMLNVRQSHTFVEVLLEYPLRRRLNSASFIRRMTKNYHMVSAAVESAIVDGEFYMFGCEGEADWHVRGPLEAMESIVSVYWFVAVEGPYLPAMLLAMELSDLKIHIADGVLGTQDLPTQFHTGDLANARITDEPEFLRSLPGVVGELEKAVVKAESNEGKQLGSSLCVSSRYALVNAHIIDAAERVIVNEVAITPELQMSSDLVLVSKPSGGEVRLRYRRAVEDEQVVICYNNAGDLRYSAPLTVVRVREHSLFMTLDSTVVPGMSGGAVVAVSDGAILGLHSGANVRHLIAAVIDSNRLSGFISPQTPTTLSSISDERSRASEISFQFKSCGKGDVFKSLCSSVTSIYSGKSQVGCAVSSGQFWHTPLVDLVNCGSNYEVCDCDVFSVADLRQIKLRGKKPDKFPMHIRPPNLQEKVHVLIHLKDDVHISCPMRVLRVDAKKFYLTAVVETSDVSLLGGCIFSADGAALGVMGNKTSSTPVGLAYECWFYPPAVMLEVQGDTREQLRSLFPSLHIDAWSDELIEEVVTHSSCGSYTSGKPFNYGQRPLANVGDDIAKWSLYSRLRRNGMPYAKWSLEWQTRQSNLAMARQCWQIGLASLLRVGSGTQLPPESKAYADMVEALVGAVSMIEPTQVLETVLEKLQLIPND